MLVFLTGGSGFVGGYILKELARKGHATRVLTRTTPREPAVESGLTYVEGDVTRRESLRGLLDGCDAVIHLVGIIDEHPAKGITFEHVHLDGTRHVVDEARSSGLDRFIQMSANGARPDGVSSYQTSKFRAEEYVKQAGFEHWTIFRPAIAFGDPGPNKPEFSKRIAQTLVKTFPVLPVPGDGRYAVQPISIQELAEAFVKALDLPSASGRTYCAAGKETLTFDDVLDRISVALGHEPKPKIHHPLWMVRSAVRAAARTGMLPISPDQLEMLVEGNTCDSSDFYRDFQVEYRPYSPENLAYLRRLV